MHQQTYYVAIFLFSFLLTLLYVFHWHKQFQVHMTVMFIVISIVNLAYLLMYANHTPEASISLLKIIYIGGCFLPWLITMCELSLCRIQVPRPLWMGALLVSAGVYLSVLTIGYAPLFYKSLTIVRVGDAWIQQREYGPFHTLHYVCLALYMIADIAIVLYTYLNKKQVSRKVLLLLFIPIPVTIAAYAVSHRLMQLGYELTPCTYVLAQIVYLLIARRIGYYNVGEMVVESMVESGDTGFITVDNKGRYLGSNETAKDILPGLRQLTVDQPISEEVTLRDTVCSWLEGFQRDPGMGKQVYERDDRCYIATVNHLFDGRKQCGYQVFLQDDTQNQKYIHLLDQYNADLQAEVAVKTEHIVVMHDKLILGMAAMVESRDNSTGGHIRRTSQGVRILIDAIQKSSALQLPEEFCRNIIKAAPMHDLGKIAVDDAILRKPGRFTPEEFEMMKAHAAEGARIVHEILSGTDDESFRRIAENVAHYHHERMDGSGYPDGLKGDAIPLEARIMAIADVYDALVSKRVYKDAFSFEKADQIILEGMGTQFDPRLEPFYRGARPMLEAFYASED